MGLILFVMIVFGCIGAAMATNKRSSGIGGFCLGAFLGVIGLVIIAMLPAPAAAPDASVS